MLLPSLVHGLSCVWELWLSLSVSERAGGWDSVGFGITCPLLGIFVMAFDPKKVTYLYDLKFYELPNKQQSYQTLNAVSIFSVWYSSFLLLHTMVGETVGITGFALVKPTHCSGPLLTKSILYVYTTASYSQLCWELIQADHLRQGVRGEHTARVISDEYLDNTLSHFKRQNWAPICSFHIKRVT